MTDHRQEPREENPADFVALHEVLRAIQAVGRDEDDVGPSEESRPGQSTAIPSR